MLEEIPERGESICLWSVRLGIQAKKRVEHRSPLFPSKSLNIFFNFFNDIGLNFNKSCKNLKEMKRQGKECRP